jgi:uncharacterized protein (TIGR02145 family)
MLIKNLTGILVLGVFGISLFSCKTEEIPLHGDITGIVTDAETSEPIQAATVRLNPYNDTTITENDGTYLLKNITPGDYEIKASKFAYNTSSKPIEVEAAKTKEINFALIGIPIFSISDTFLNFELDLTSLSFAISNNGTGKLAYTFNPGKDWISVYPASGDVTDEMDSITVTIDKTGLLDSILYKETIKIISDFGIDTIDVIVNGFMYEGQAYKIVRIGTQTWMAENLNVGIKRPNAWMATDDGIVDKYCYFEVAKNCEIYGGLYDSWEALQYNPSDTGSIGTTRGICPNGWHIPTEKEWYALRDYLGGSRIAGGKIKESGYAHWTTPNTGATNETGFRALPGGIIEPRPGGEGVEWSYEIDSSAFFWTATIPPGGEPIDGYYFGSHLELKYDNSLMGISFYPERIFACSVRCIKDP